MKKAIILLLALTLLMGGVLGGCTNNPDAPSASAGSSSAPADAGSSAPADSAPDSSGEPAAPAGKSTITVGVFEDIISFDPHGYSGIASTVPGRHIYDTLIRLNPDEATVKPCLAESWEVINDGMSIRFNLRKGVKYHNGEDFTSEDVKFSIERHMGTVLTFSMVSSIESVEIEDEYTVIVNMKSPCSGMTLTNLAYAACGIVDKTTTEALEAEGKTLDENPIGTGTHKFVSYLSGDSVVLAKNENYWGEPAKHEELILRIIPDDAARAIALETGEIDISLNVPTADVERVRNNPDLELDEFLTTGMEFVYLNTTVAPLDNKLVRQALSHLINREAIIAIAENGLGIPLYSPVGEGHSYYMPDVVKYEYDVDKAKALLAEAGYPDGFEISLVTIIQPRVRAAQVMQADFEKAGIKLNIELIENAKYLEMTKNGEHQMASSAWNSTADPNGTFPALFSNGPSGTSHNRSKYSNDTIEPMMEDGRNGDTLEERFAKYKPVQEIIMEDAAIIPLYSKMGVIGRRKGLQGLEIYPTTQHRLDQLHY